jgi:hypothetical protein
MCDRRPATIDGHQRRYRDGRRSARARDAKATHQLPGTRPINNAGIALFGPTAEFDVSAFDKMFASSWVVEHGSQPPGAEGERGEQDNAPRSGTAPEPPLASSLTPTRRWPRALAWIEAAMLTVYGLVLTVVGLLVQADVLTASRHADHRALAWHAFLWDPGSLCWGMLVTMAMVTSRATSNQKGGLRALAGDPDAPEGILSEVPLNSGLHAAAHAIRRTQECRAPKTCGERDGGP